MWPLADGSDKAGAGFWWSLVLIGLVLIALILGRKDDD